MWKECGLLECDAYRVHSVEPQRRGALTLPMYAPRWCESRQYYTHNHHQSVHCFGRPWAWQAYTHTSCSRWTFWVQCLCADIALIEMYALCKSFEDGLAIFHSTGQNNVVVLNALITAYFEQGLRKEAFALFDRLDTFTYVNLLKMCTKALKLEEGKC